MKKLCILALFWAAGAALAQADDLLAGSTPISGDELKARLSGKSFTWQPLAEKLSGRVKYDGNGYAFISLSNGLSDSGRWSIGEGGKICVEWRKFPSGCAPETRAKGDLLLMQRANGSWATMTLN